MAKIVGVRFRNTGKVYYFAPGDITGLEKGKGVIVETARGMEFGTISMPVTTVRDSEVIRPLKRVVRIATEEDIRNRLTQLRMKKGVSEYQMSLDLGHSKSYIQGISSGRALPPMSEFLVICDYLAISP